MPYNVTDGAIMEVQLLGELFGQRTLNVLHFRLQQASPTPLDGTTGINEFDEQFNAVLGGGFPGALMQGLSQDFGLEAIQYQWIWPTRYALEQRAAAVEEGGVLEASLPPNDTMVITKQADLTGPHARGNFYIPGVPVTYSEQGQVSNDGLVFLSGFRTNLSAQYSFLLGGIAQLMIPVIYNRADPDNSMLITHATVRSVLRVQRRRTVGVGI